MSDIAKAMEKKGYIPLLANRFCAIGLRPSLSGFIRRPGMQKWFYNGTYMQDGRPIAIAAYSEAEAEEFRKRGLRPVEEGAAAIQTGHPQRCIRPPAPRRPKARLTASAVRMASPRIPAISASRSFASTIRWTWFVWIEKWISLKAEVDARARAYATAPAQGGETRY